MIVVLIEYLLALVCILPMRGFVWLVEWSAGVRVRKTNQMVVFVLFAIVNVVPATILEVTTSSFWPWRAWAIWGVCTALYWIIVSITSPYMLMEYLRRAPWQKEEKGAGEGE